MIWSLKQIWLFMKIHKENLAHISYQKILLEFSYNYYILCCFLFEICFSYYFWGNNSGYVHNLLLAQILGNYSCSALGTILMPAIKLKFSYMEEKNLYNFTSPSNFFFVFWLLFLICVLVGLLVYLIVSFLWMYPTVLRAYS